MLPKRSGGTNEQISCKTDRTQPAYSGRMKLSNAMSISRVLAAFTAAAVTLSLGPSEKAHTIKFEPVVGGKRFACGSTYAGLGTSKSAVTPQFLRLYVSGVELIDASGKTVPLKLDQDGTWQQQDVAFLSFEGKNSACASGSPHGTYRHARRSPWFRRTIR